jgi:hypothetical protein
MLTCQEDEGSNQRDTGRREEWRGEAARELLVPTMASRARATESAFAGIRIVIREWPRTSINGIGRFDEIYWRNARSFERTPLIAVPMPRL